MPFPLAILHCTTHGKSFTVYPPGLLPRRRQPLLPATPDGAVTGELLNWSEPDEELLRDTIFEAAADAASGHRWSRDTHNNTTGTRQGGWWTTQRRLLNWATVAVGVAPGLPSRVRQHQSEALDVPMLFLQERSVRVASPGDYKTRGTCVVEVLQEVVLRLCSLDRLAESCFLAGLCGQPIRWAPTPTT